MVLSGRSQVCGCVLSDDEAPGCAQVKVPGQLQNLRQPSSASPNKESMSQRHRESRSQTTSLLGVCSEALDLAGGCWCLPPTAPLRPTEEVCQVRSSTGAQMGVRSEPSPDSL